MARIPLDPTLNGDLGQMIAALNTMLAELYEQAGIGGTLDVTAVNASGAVSADSVAVTNAVEAGSVSSTGAVEAGSFVTTGLAQAGGLQLDTGTKTASAVAGAATLNKDAGVITSEDLTTAAGDEYTLTLTNSSIAAGDQVFASVQNGTNTKGPIRVTTVTPGSGSVVIKVQNGHAADALDGTIKIAFAVLKN